MFHLLPESVAALGNTMTAYLMAGHLHTAVLVPFAAGNFISIALADLVPELTTTPAAHDKAIHTVGFTTCF